MEIAIGIPGYSCPNLIRMTSPLTLTQKLTHLSGGRGFNQGVGEQSGHRREKGEQTVLLRRSQKTDVDVPRCP